jgi:hypothetical protein
MQLTLGMLLPPRYSMLLLLGMLLSLGMLLPSGHAASPGHAALLGACWVNSHDRKTFLHYFLWCISVHTLIVLHKR